MDSKKATKKFLTLFVALFLILYFKLLFGLKAFTHDSFFWFPTVTFFIDSIAQGELPLWNPFLVGGTPFYPNIHTLGLLDPLIWVSFICQKVFGFTPYNAYAVFYLGRLALYIWGAYLLFAKVADHKISAVISTGVMFFVMAPLSFSQNGSLDSCFLIPMCFYFFLQYLEVTKTNRKMLYLVGMSLTAGIAANIYIPSYFLFGIVVFFGGHLLFRRHALGQNLISQLSSAKIMLCVFLLGLMVTPGLFLKMFDFGPKSELFPYVRVLLSNKDDGGVKKFNQLVTETDGSVFSTEARENYNVNSSLGNLLGPVMPQMFRSSFAPHPPYNHSESTSEAIQYYGIVPLFLLLLGLIFGQNRHKGVFLFCLILTALEMYNLNGVHYQEPTIFQTALNKIMPFLGLIEVKTNFYNLFVVFLFFFLVLGIDWLIDVGRHISLQTYGVILTLAVLLVGTRLLANQHFFGHYVLGTGEEAIALGQLALILILFSFYSLKNLSTKNFYLLLTVMATIDLVIYSYDIKAHSLTNPSLKPELYREEAKSNATRRLPFVQITKPQHRSALAFSESYAKEKTAFSKGKNHHLFTTKRYYDFMTHVPLANQFHILRMNAPLIDFYFKEDVLEFDETSNLKELALAKPQLLRDKLFIRGFRKSPKEQLSLPRIDFSNLKKESIVQYHAGPWKYEKKRRRESQVKIETIAQTNNSLKLSVTTPKEGYLYLADGFSKYWKAEIDGVPTKIVPSNFIFKSLWVTRGTHDIKLEYRPKHYSTAFWLYHAGLVGLLGLVFVYRKREV